MQLQCQIKSVKNFGRNNKIQQTIPEFVNINRFKRFVERHSSDSADGDDLRAGQDSNEMSTIDTSADSDKAVSSLLNTEAQPWFPLSKGRLLRQIKRLICEM